MAIKLEKVFGDSWGDKFNKHLDLEYFTQLGNFLNEESKDENILIFPHKEDIFNAFKFTSFENTNVVFLGLDPYIRSGQAYGISFGVKESCRIIPASLRNIYKEVENDVYNGLSLDFDYSLKQWCDQGCLMLNTALTVKEGATGSHLKVWHPFTKTVFTILNEKDFLIYVLLGRKAQEYKKYIKDSPNFHIIKASHPAAESYSGGSAGFFGSKIFTQINQILINNGREQIKW